MSEVSNGEAKAQKGESGHASRPAGSTDEGQRATGPVLGRMDLTCRASVGGFASSTLLTQQHNMLAADSSCAHIGAALHLGPPCHAAAPWAALAPAVAAHPEWPHMQRCAFRSSPAAPWPAPAPAAPAPAA